MGCVLGCALHAPYRQIVGRELILALGKIKYIGAFNDTLVQHFSVDNESSSLTP